MNTNPVATVLSFQFSGDQFVMSDGRGTVPLADFSFNLTEKSSSELKKSFMDILNSYERIEPFSIPPAPKLDIIAFLCGLYLHVLKTTGRHLLMLETGGYSSCASFIASQVLRFFSGDNYLLCCRGPNENNDEFLDEWSCFRSVTRTLGTLEQVMTISGDFQKTESALGDNRFDIILIDGSRRYGDLLRDLQSAVKRIKPGGLLIGFDCECSFCQLPNEVRDRPSAESESMYGPFHTGVIAALETMFGRDYVKPIPQSSVWIKTVTENAKSKFQMESDGSDDQTVYENILVSAGNIKTSVENLLQSKSTKGCGETLEIIGRSFAALEKQIKSRDALRSLKFDFVKAYGCFMNTLSAYDGSSRSIESLLKEALVFINDLIAGIMFAGKAGATL